MIAVVTAPDKPAGRGLQLHESPVKKYAAEKGINMTDEILSNLDIKEGFSNRTLQIGRASCRERV